MIRHIMPTYWNLARVGIWTFYRILYAYRCMMIYLLGNYAASWFQMAHNLGLIN